MRSIMRAGGWLLAVLCMLTGVSGLYTCFQAPKADGVAIVLALCLLGLGLALARWLRRSGHARREDPRSGAGGGPTRGREVAEALFQRGPSAAFEELKAQSGAVDMRKATLAAVPGVMRQALEDGIISEDEERRINEFCALAGLDNGQLPEPWRTRLVASGLLRDLLSGTVNPRLEGVPVPFNLQKKEKLIWIWPTIPAWELKTEQVWEAGMQGANIRVMKGVYWRVGATKARRVPQDVRRSLGSGPLAVTERHIYYQAGTTTLRLKFDNVISMLPTADGVLVGRDGARATPLEFGFSDPWFALNILTNAKNWAE